jgi:hypothetical protein
LNYAVPFKFIPLVEKEAPCMIQLIQEIHTREGKKGFSRGIIPNIIKLLRAAGISCVVNEKAKPFWGLM